MKILLISFSTRGAIGDYVFLLAKELAKKINLFLMVPDYFNRESIENAKIIKIRTGKNKFLTFLNLINPINLLFILKKISEIRPDLIHLFFGEGYPPTFLILLYLKIKKIPLIITLHDPEVHPGNFIETINGFLRIIPLKLSSGIHIHSKVFVDEVKKMGVKENKIFIIPHGSFAPLFAKFKNLTIKKENMILFFGRLEKYKGLEYLVEAGLRLKGKFKVIIAGPGLISANLLKTIKQHPNIFILKNYYISEKEAAELFQKAKICVMPYVQATQSAIPLLSAFFGVPIVGTKKGAFVEDIPRVNGVLVEPKNVDDLIRGIHEALKKKPYYPQEIEFSFLVDDFLRMYEKTIVENKI